MNKSKLLAVVELLEYRKLLAAVEGLDTSFGKNGLAAVPADVLVAPLSNGEYLAVGSNRVNDEDSPAPNVSLLTSNGNLDTSFGSGGQTIVSGIGEGAKGVLAGNDAYIYTNLDGGLTEVLALGQDGKINTNFGSDGVVKIPPPPLIKGDVFDEMTVDGIAAQSDGSLIVSFRAVEAPKGGGTVTHLSELARVSADGKFDTSFGTDGFALVASHVDNSKATLSGSNLAIDSQDRIDVTTEISGQPLSPQVDRFNADGTLDTTFGDKGAVQLQKLTNSQGISITAPMFADQLAVQADDKIVVAGTVDEDFNLEPAQVIRINTDGSIDTTFGTHDQEDIYVPVGGTVTVESVKVDSQGRIVVFNGSSVARLSSAGALDTTFGTSGAIDLVDPLNAAGLTSSAASNVALDADDRIIAGYENDVVRLAPEPPATLDKKGTLHVNGSDGNDVIGIAARDGETLHVNVNDDVLKFALADVKKIDIELGAGVNTSDEYVNINTTVNADSGDSGSDSILTGGGDDAITAFGPSVSIDGGAGDDHIHAGGGTLLIHGSAGNDLIEAPTATSASIFGDDGNDSITGSPGDDFLYGGAGKDTIRGENGNDLLSGNGGNDRLFGNAGNDHIHGGDGNDIVNTVDGVVDIVDGGAGTDTATVDNGIDTVTNVENVS